MNWPIGSWKNDFLKFRQGYFAIFILSPLGQVRGPPCIYIVFTQGCFKLGLKSLQTARWTEGPTDRRRTTGDQKSLCDFISAQMSLNQRMLNWFFCLSIWLKSLYEDKCVNIIIQCNKNKTLYNCLTSSILQPPSMRNA